MPVVIAVPLGNKPTVCEFPAAMVLIVDKKNIKIKACPTG
jgi:hypothetical protein